MCVRGAALVLVFSLTWPVYAQEWIPIEETQEFQSFIRDIVHVPRELVGDPLAEAMRCLTPLIVMTLVHETDFRLRNPAIRECGIRPLYTGDHRAYFSATQRRNFDHHSGIVSVSEHFAVAVYAIEEASGQFNFVNRRLEEGREYGLGEVRRLASITFRALEFSGQDVGHTYFLLEEDSGDLVFQPFFAKHLAAGHVTEIVRSPQTDAMIVEAVPDAAPIVERNPTDAPGRRASAGVVLNSRQSPVALYRAMIIAGGLLIAATGAWWFLRVVRA